jgi:tRNA threonylcarbamoyladenosine biosynthesis protein TsaE
MLKKMATKQTVTNNENETINLAKTIASCFHIGDVIILDGDLGTGKTHFIKGFTDELGSKNLVTSPTFTIAHFYDISEGSVLHIDAYRLTGIDEFRDTGLVDYFPQSIVLIEWGTKIIDEFDEYMLISFEYVPSRKNKRKIKFSYFGEKYAAKFNLLSQKLDNLQ